MNKKCTNPSCRKTFSTLHFAGSCPYCRKKYPQIAVDSWFWSVRILGYRRGNRKIMVIKSIRNAFHLTIRESKAAADRIPNVEFVLEKKEADQFVREFPKMGVIYEIKRTAARNKSILYPY